MLISIALVITGFFAAYYVVIIIMELMSSNDAEDSLKPSQEDDIDISDIANSFDTTVVESPITLSRKRLKAEPRDKDRDSDNNGQDGSIEGDDSSGIFPKVNISLERGIEVSSFLNLINQEFGGAIGAKAALANICRYTEAVVA